MLCLFFPAHAYKNTFSLSFSAVIPHRLGAPLSSPNITKPKKHMKTLGSPWLCLGLGTYYSGNRGHANNEAG